jgi:hypothetical protein
MPFHGRPTAPAFFAQKRRRVIRRIKFPARLGSRGAKIARKYQKSSKNLKKMLSASKILELIHLPLICGGPFEGQPRICDDVRWGGPACSEQTQPGQPTQRGRVQLVDRDASFLSLPIS